MPQVSKIAIGNKCWVADGNHHLRFGGEVHYHQWRGGANLTSYGAIDFARFSDFLVGNSDFSALGIGIAQRDFRSTDYAAFLQDNWKFSSRFTLNLGLRYELDLPPYETRGQVGGFEPALYRPSQQVDSNGLPVGPPAAGYFQAANVLPQFNLPGIPKVGKRMLKSVGPWNFGPASVSHGLPLIQDGARQLPADLIVMGRERPASAANGGAGTASRTLAQAPCPVVIVPETRAAEGKQELAELSRAGQEHLPAPGAYTG